MKRVGRGNHSYVDPVGDCGLIAVMRRELIEPPRFGGGKMVCGGRLCDP